MKLPSDLARTRNEVRASRRGRRHRLLLDDPEAGRLSDWETSMECRLDRITVAPDPSSEPD